MFIVYWQYCVALRSLQLHFITVTGYTLHSSSGWTLGLGTGDLSPDGLSSIQTIKLFNRIRCPTI